MDEVFMTFSLVVVVVVGIWKILLLYGIYCSGVSE